MCMWYFVEQEFFCFFLMNAEKSAYLPQIASDIFEAWVID